MLEVDAALHPFEVSDLGGEALLDLVTDARHAEWRAGRRKLRLAYQLCVTNPAGPGIDPATWGDGLPGMAGDYDATLGGEGTPLVARFVVEDWAAACGVSRAAAQQFLANTLDLHHRLPRTHARVEGLELESWKALRLAEDTHDLSLACARWIDAFLHETGRYSCAAMAKAVKHGVAKFHPDRLEDGNGLRGRDDWDVTVDHEAGAEGTSTLEAIGSSLDLAKFHDLVCDEATTLGRLGDGDSLGQRKAKALAVIADRQATLDLLGLLDQDPPVHPDTGKAVARRRSYLKARLFVHLSLADLATLCASAATVPPGAAGVVATNLFGPATTTLIGGYLKQLGADARVTPVIDTTRTWAVDAHDPPTAMREQVVARDPHCVHPYCARASTSCDLDHIVAFDDTGPPGQTNPGNLAPLCRGHHVLKTHGGWRYQRNRDGTYTWTNQHGRSWLVTDTGTIELTDNP
ncbi:HNH endonuclease [Nocardioides sp. JQ2195]|uniref:HNH endonuclease signature motif containing protein n=1 Tax=Nocardioides sp. JQ2195 TaxID=2592334 RepID=UPI00143E659E|nr:HNH endonuclease signature motif containing protein [Nocardioides sp. JQ2195]QIX26464.1 HNH endonuclease [Nocardioides sp. JQ2195]